MKYWIVQWPLFLGLVVLVDDHSLFAGDPAPQTQPAQSGNATTDEARQLEATATRFGMTVPQLKQFVANTLGEPLLYDRKRKVVVSWEANPDKSARVVHVVPDPLGPEKASVDYHLGSETAEARVTYAGPLPKNADDVHGVIWQDLNADGVFDLLLIPVKHNGLLNMDRGWYILLDGKWTAAVSEPGRPNHTMRVEKTTYRFDAATGRWKSEQ